LGLDALGEFHLFLRVEFEHGDSMARLARTQRVRFTLLILCAAPRASIFAQHEGHSASPIDSSATRFGSVSFANSGAASAQPAFLRGLALLHNFQYEGAASAFRDAQQRDPGFAMAYWGEAMTYNHGIWRAQDSVKARAVLMRLGKTPADRLAKAKTPREKDYLRTLDVLYFGPGTKNGRDSAYAVETGRLAARYADDVDGQLFYSLALLSLIPRTDSTYLRAAKLAERVMRDHPTHPGALHYVIHGYDDPAHANQGLAAARAYSKVAPDAPHAQHMTSHIFVALGMWDDVVAANEVAIGMVAKTSGPSVAPAAACGHAGLWLHYAYLQQGRLAEARRLSSACHDRTATSMDAASGYAEMRLQYLVDVERPEPSLTPLVSKLSGMIDLTQSYATAYDNLRRGDTSTTNALIARMHTQAAAMKGSEMAMMMPEMVGEANVVETELRAMADARRGKLGDAITELTRAAGQEDSLPYEFGPPPIEKPSHELLGEMLLAAGRPSDARREFEIALKRTPGRSLVLLDLARACAAMGDKPAATSAFRQLATNWKNADSTVAAVREARAGAK
jgi:tetratricopeptide (TPR) repeat protein